MSKYYLSIYNLLNIQILRSKRLFKKTNKQTHIFPKLNKETHRRIYRISRKHQNQIFVLPTNREEYLHFEDNSVNPNYKQKFLARIMLLVKNI